MIRDAKSYKRIAGYFHSSIFELVGEEITAIPKVQIVCNSELDPADVAISQLLIQIEIDGNFAQECWRGGMLLSDFRCFGKNGAVNINCIAL